MTRRRDKVAAYALASMCQWAVVSAALGVGEGNSAESPPQATRSVDSEYWATLNSGRDVRSWARHAQQLAFAAPAERAAARPAARDAIATLRETQPIDAIQASNVTTADPVSQANWPTLGGDTRHVGSTADRGPVRGEVVWRAAVGWDYRAGPVVVDDLIVVTSPDADAVLRAFDRRTGRTRWITPWDSAEYTRAVKAWSTPSVLADGRVMVTLAGPDASPRELVVANLRDGVIQQRGVVRPIAQRFAKPAPLNDPAGLVIVRGADGRSVVARRLDVDATWWTFPTGRVTHEPVRSNGLVFVGDDDGTFAALHCVGDSRVAWSHRSDAPWRSRPTVVGDTVLAPSEDGSIWAFDASTGDARWHRQISQPQPAYQQLFSRATIAGNFVLVGDATGRVVALDLTTGDPVWRAQATDAIRAAPVVVRASEAEESPSLPPADATQPTTLTVVVATLSGTVEAWEIDLEARDAEPLWSVRPTRHAVLADLATDGESVFVASGGLELFALEPHTGATRWRSAVVAEAEDRRDFVESPTLATAPPQLMQAPVTVAEGVVYAAGPDRMVRAIEAATGRLRWRYESSGRIAATPSVAGGRVYVGQFGGDRSFVAIDAKTGKPAWARSLGWVWATPTAVGDRVFVGTTEGRFFCVDARTGANHWQTKFGGGVYSAPCCDNASVFTGAWDGHYYALDQATGKVRWAWSPPGWPYDRGGRPDSAAPVLVGENVVAPIHGRAYVALNRETGTQAWRWDAPAWRIANATVATDGETVFASVFGNAYERPFGAALFALDARTGRQRWRLGGVGGLTAPVVTGAGMLVSGSLDQTALLGYRMSRDADQPPELAWRVPTRGVMMESLPAVSGARGYFLVNDGCLYAVR